MARPIRKAARGSLPGELQEEIRAPRKTAFRIGAISQSEESRRTSPPRAKEGYEAVRRGQQRTGIVAEKGPTPTAVASYLKTGDGTSAARVSTEWLAAKFPKERESRRRACAPVGDPAADPAASSRQTAGRSSPGSAPISPMPNRRWSPRPGSSTASATARARSAEWQRLSSGVAKGDPRRGQVLLQLAKSYEATSNDTDAVRTLRECMARAPELEAQCGARLSDLYFRLKNDEEGLALLRKVAGQAGKKKGQSVSPYVGYARFRLAERIRRQKSLTPLELPEANLKKALGERLEFLGELSRAYNSVVDAGGPWAIAALDGLATWAVGFADEVDRIQPSPGTPPAAVEGFRKQLRSVSDPLRKKAMDTWLDAYRKALAAEVLSPALPGICDRLAELKAPTPFRAQGFHGKLRLAGMQVDGELAVARARRFRRRPATPRPGWTTETRSGARARRCFRASLTSGRSRSAPGASPRSITAP